MNLFALGLKQHFEQIYLGLDDNVDKVTQNSITHSVIF
jgi:hypothetical protein